ncbi:MAG: hypothetical protein DRI83_06700 [Bacteroidetes bacterium]|nr:MAG: hypothetical protein DRI83_06700 [Bacteroidota bacterium]
MYRFGGTEGYYKNLVPLLRNEIGLIPRGLAPRIINFKDFFIPTNIIDLKSLHQIFILALLAISPLLSFSQGTWEVHDVPTSQHLRSVFFTDSMYGWAVGDTGTIIHTSDGGENWLVQDAGTDNNIVNVFFLNRQVGWASSWNFNGFYGTLILKTTDGGDTWTGTPYQEENIFMNDILFFDSLTGWMAGSPHALVKTIDGGQSWNQAAIDTNALAFFPVLKVFFYDESHGYACGGMFDIAGVIWSTSDGGEMWYPIKNEDAPADEVHGLHIFDPVTVLGAGGDPELGYGIGMIRTHDAGVNWEYEELNLPGAAYDLDFRNDTEAWAPLGASQKLLYSMDAGSSWTRIPSPEELFIFDMVFPDSMHGYAVGYHGAFIRYIPLGVGLDELEDSNIHMRIYPNPAKDQIMLEFDLGDGSGGKWNNGEVLVSDCFGRPLISHSLHQLSGGKNMLNLDVSSLAAGLYFCRLKIEGREKTLLETHKLILR